MKAKKILGLVCIVALAIPMLASAEIYKWKDKNGVTRYSDTPPSTGQANTLRAGREAKRTTKPAAEAASSTAVTPNTPQDKFVDAPDPDEEAARVRSRAAETEKRNKQEKEKTAKLNKENCNAAKSNYATFKQGGRIYKTNPNGEREYYGDEELNAQKSKAQAEVRRYCK